MFCDLAESGMSLYSFQHLPTYIVFQMRQIDVMSDEKLTATRQAILEMIGSLAICLPLPY